jgi:hypothetical protein
MPVIASPSAQPPDLVQRRIRGLERYVVDQNVDASELGRRLSIDRPAMGLDDVTRHRRKGARGLDLISDLTACFPPRITPGNGAFMAPFRAGCGF